MDGAPATNERWPDAGAASMARMATVSLVCVLLLAAMALASEVRLRGTVFLEGAEPVVLGNIAILIGPDAERHAALVVVRDPMEVARGRSWIEIDGEAVRAALVASGANMGRLAITGSSCTVRLLGAPTPMPEPRRPVRRERERGEPMPVEFPEFTTVRGSIGSAICAMMGLPPDDVRLAYPGSDEAWLDEARRSERVLALPRSNTSSARLLVEVKIYDGEALVDERTVRVDALVRRSVVTLSASVERGEQIAPAVLLMQTQWLEPSALTPISEPDGVAGQVARRRLPPGTVLLPDHVEPPILVRRNELIRVTAITRGVVVETDAHALSDGKRGERVTLRRAGSAERFTAVVEARGRVVVRMD